MPAFYNSHGHSPMALMRGYGENMVLQDWLNKLIFPFEDKLDSNAVYWGTTLSMAESMRFGIVSTTDMYYFIDDMVRATDDAGMKANISRAIVNFDDSDVWQLPSMQEMKRTFEAYHNMNDKKMIENAGLGIAMGQSTPQIKEIANQITDSNCEDGVATFLEKCTDENRSQRCILYLNQ